MASLVRLSNQSNHGRQPVRSLVDFWCTNCQGNLSADPPSFLFFMSWGGVNPETRLVTNTKDRPFRITPLAVPTVLRPLQNPSKSQSEVTARLAEAHFKAHRRDDKSLKEDVSQRHAAPSALRSQTRACGPPCGPTSVLQLKFLCRLRHRKKCRENAFKASLLAFFLFFTSFSPNIFHFLMRHKDKQLI